MKVAIIGSGISGLAAAHALGSSANITLFEANSYFGGHANTVNVTLPTPAGNISHGIDTGFLVFNQKTYPELIRLFKSLDVSTATSDMSFSVQVPNAFRQRNLEWSGSNLNTVFSQRSNFLRPRFWLMLKDILRFNTLCTKLANNLDDKKLLTQTLEDFLAQHKFGQTFREWYLLPMLGCIWSCPTQQMLQFPVATMIRFCHNHGLVQVTDRPQWLTVNNGSRQYVEKITASIADKRLNTPVLQIRRNQNSVQILTANGLEHFDHVIMATHSDQALALLEQATPRERDILGAIQYQTNHAILHTDTAVLPDNKRAWASWNYERSANTDASSARICLHYLINRLQPLPFSQPVIVSLNPVKPINPATIIGEYEYDHPVFDMAAIYAQKTLKKIQGQHRTWYCGAWTGYGFHEDGLVSGMQVARQLLAEHADSLKKAA